MAAAHSGVAALKMADSPALMASSATPYSTKGSAELTTPSHAMARQWARSAAPWPCHSNTGNRNIAAPRQRSAASAIGPNSGTLRRINRNDAPHSAANASNSERSRVLKSSSVEPPRGG